jgi:hypothetical protein
MRENKKLDAALRDIKRLKKGGSFAVNLKGSGNITTIRKNGKRVDAVAVKSTVETYNSFTPSGLFAPLDEFNTHKNNASIHHTHSNKIYLDTFSLADTNVLDHLFVVDGVLHTDLPFYSEQSNAAYGLGTSGGGGLVEESDPIFTAHAAHGITSTKITNWDAAYTFVSAGGDLNADFNADILTANSYVKVGGTSSQFLKANGDVDSNTYVITTDSRLSDARPASDVYAWAKAATKPSYTYSEVGADASGAAGTAVSTHENTYNHANIANGQTAYGWGDHASVGYALSSALTTHAGLTTTAHGLGGSAFHDSDYYYRATNPNSYVSLSDLTGVFQPYDADLASIAALTGVGLLERTDVNTWSINTNNYATTGDLSTHAGLTTTAHGLGGSAFHDSDYYYRATNPNSYVSLSDLTGVFQPYDADLNAISGLTGTGLLRKTAVNTWSLDSTLDKFNDMFTLLGSGTELDPYKIQANYAFYSLYSNAAYGLGTSGGGGLTEESDPIFVASPAYGITATKINHWDTAYTHSQIVGGTGVHISDTERTNWSTAYADRFKWDGGATGLDAATGRSSLGLGSAALRSDTYFALLGGSASQDFNTNRLYSNALQITDFNASFSGKETFISAEYSTLNAATADFNYGIRLKFHRSSEQYYTDIISSLYHDRLFFRRYTEFIPGSWMEIYHSGNFNSTVVTNALGYTPANISGSASQAFNASTLTASSYIQATTAKFTNLHNGYLPYVTADGLMDSGYLWDGTNALIGYTSNPASYKLAVNGSGFYNGNLTLSSATDTFLQIGGARLVWDGTALKVVGSDGTTPVSFYATGSNAAYGLGTSGGGGLTEESDPIFAASPAHGITAGKINNWDAAFTFVSAGGDLNADFSGDVITGNSFVKTGGTGTNLLLDNGSVTPASNFLTSSDLTGYASQTWVEQKGYVTGTPWTGMGYLTAATLPVASDSVAGIVSTTTQTFAGGKIFIGGITSTDLMPESSGNNYIGEDENRWTNLYCTNGDFSTSLTVGGTDVSLDGHTHNYWTETDATTSVKGIMTLGAAGGAATYGHNHDATYAYQNGDPDISFYTYTLIAHDIEEGGVALASKYAAIGHTHTSLTSGLSVSKSTGTIFDVLSGTTSKLNVTSSAITASVDIDARYNAISCSQLNEAGTILAEKYAAIADKFPGFGTTGTTAAYGNHNHSEVYATAGHNHDTTYAALAGSASQAFSADYLTIGGTTNGIQIDETAIYSYPKDESIMTFDQSNAVLYLDWVTDIISLVINGQPVTFGANGSGGTGYRVLLVPNA